MFTRSKRESEVVSHSLEVSVSGAKTWETEVASRFEIGSVPVLCGRLDKSRLPHRPL